MRDRRCVVPLAERAGPALLSLQYTQCQEDSQCGEHQQNDWISENPGERYNLHASVAPCSCIRNWSGKVLHMAWFPTTLTFAAESFRVSLLRLPIRG